MPNTLNRKTKKNINKNHCCYLPLKKQTNTEEHQWRTYTYIHTCICICAHTVTIEEQVYNQLLSAVIHTYIYSFHVPWETGNIITEERERSAMNRISEERENM